MTGAMKSAALVKLQRLLGVASNAEASRLAGVMAEIAACRVRAARLRREIGSSGAASAQSSAPGGGRLVAGELVAAELAVASRWGLRLAERARAEDARAAGLEVEAETIRPRLARAFGRVAAAASMASRAGVEERRLAARRAEGAVIAPRRAPDQPVSSGSEPAGRSAGSPGIA